jgi:antitoxin MazE
MKFETEIKQWGNSLALRISSAMAQEPMFAKGISVVIETSDGLMTIKPKQKSGKFTLPFNENELTQDLNAYTSHADELASHIDKEFWVE